MVSLYVQEVRKNLTHFRIQYLKYQDALIESKLLHAIQYLLKVFMDGQGLQKDPFFLKDCA